MTRSEGAAVRTGCPGRDVPLLDLPLPLPGVTLDLVLAYRPRVPALSRRIAERICGEVAGFSDPAVGVAVHRAIGGAVRLFVDVLAGAPARGQDVADRFRALGGAEAKAGHDLDALRAAHHVATQVAWEELCGVAREFALPSESLTALATGLLEYQQHLLAESTAGFRVRHGGLEAGGDDPVARFVRGLAVGADVEELRTMAPAGWPPAHDVVVVSCRAGRAVETRARSLPGVFSAVWRERLVVLVVDAEPCDVAAALTAAGPGPVAVSWPVRPHDVVHAVRWTGRALRLARQRTVAVPADGVLRCLALRSELALHADPALREHLRADVLAPLEGEKPSHREALESTLLLWLQTRGSAPAIAAELGVHSQTVRHRLRRLRALFGDALDDHRRSAEILQALQSDHGLPG